MLRGNIVNSFGRKLFLRELKSETLRKELHGIRRYVTTIDLPDYNKLDNNTNRKKVRSTTQLKVEWGSIIGSWLGPKSCMQHVSTFLGSNQNRRQDTLHFCVCY